MFIRVLESKIIKNQVLVAALNGKNKKRSLAKIHTCKMKDNNTQILWLEKKLI
jgi:hypothetical protein